MLPVSGVAVFPLSPTVMGCPHIQGETPWGGVSAAAAAAATAGVSCFGPQNCGKTPSGVENVDIPDEMVRSPPKQQVHSQKAFEATFAANNSHARPEA